MKVPVFLWLIAGLLLFSRAATFAQIPAVAWQKTYGDPVNQEYAYASARLGPDLYVHAGQQYVPSLNDAFPMLLFTRANGDSLYTRIINNYYLGRILGMASNDDGTFVATGTYYAGAGILSIFLIKINQLARL